MEEPQLNPAEIPEGAQCPACGYLMSGLPEPRCPECGRTFTWSEILFASARRLRAERRSALWWFAASLLFFGVFGTWNTLRWLDEIVFLVVIVVLPALAAACAIGLLPAFLAPVSVRTLVRYHWLRTILLPLAPLTVMLLLATVFDWSHIVQGLPHVTAAKDWRSVLPFLWYVSLVPGVVALAVWPMLLVRRLRNADIALPARVWFAYLSLLLVLLGVSAYAGLMLCMMIAVQNV